MTNAMLQMHCDNGLKGLQHPLFHRVPIALKTIIDVMELKAIIAVMEIMAEFDECNGSDSSNTYDFILFALMIIIAVMTTMA